jgi:hypothetical protein
MKRRFVGGGVEVGPYLVPDGPRQASIFLSFALVIAPSVLEALRGFSCVMRRPREAAPGLALVVENSQSYIYYQHGVAEVWLPVKAEL